MKRGGYDLGHSIFYFLLVAFFFSFPLLWLKYYTGQQFIDAQRDKELTEDYLLSRYVVDCFSTSSPADAVVLGTFSLTAFTDARLKQCTSEPFVATLKLPGEAGLQVVATDERLKKYTSLQTIRQETVLVDGHLALLTVGVPDETTRTG